MARTEIGGTIFFKVDGEQLQTVGKVKTDYDGQELTPVVGSGGNVIGHTTKHHAPEIEIEVAADGSTSVKALMALRGVTLTMELGNGKTIVLERASQMNRASEDHETGMVSLKFYGFNLLELLA